MSSGVLAMIVHNTTDPISFCLVFQLLYYSAHYPTMFSLFSALGLNKMSDSPLRRIPYYASLVFFELLHDSNNDKFVVQFSFKNDLEVSVEATIFGHFPMNLVEDFNYFLVLTVDVFSSHQVVVKS